jgi:membrane-associated phospholipid phosphatase
MKRLIPYLRNFTESLNATDRLLIAFWGFLACLNLVFNSRIPNWPFLVLALLAAILLLCLIARHTRSTAAPWVRAVHEWSAFPLVLFTYKILHYIISPFHQGRDFDSLLIAADRCLLGANPADLLSRISHPLLTELLQIAYTIFYLYFIAAGIELYRRTDISRFLHFRFTVVYGFITSYIVYFLFPAVGPRFTLYQFSRINSDLPGLFVTGVFRRFVDFFESVPPDVSDQIARAAVQRDVFPSGHTMLTLIVIVLAYRYRLRIRHLLLVAGLLLIFATVYLRYHYLIDVLAGIALALFCLATNGRLHAWFGNKNDSWSKQDI